jgi:hypothetical protein
MTTVTKLCFHAKIGGDLTGHFREPETFFATSALAAQRYAEHVCYNEFGGWDLDDTGVEELVLQHGFVLYPARVTLQRAAILNRPFLTNLGKKLGVSENGLNRFVDNFEDSAPEERTQVFAWLRENGYDGAILTADMMPVFAGGDSCYRESIVSFVPEQQVQFALSLPKTEYPQWNEAQDLAICDAEESPSKGPGWLTT